MGLLHLDLAAGAGGDGDLNVVADAVTAKRH